MPTAELSYTPATREARLRGEAIDGVRILASMFEARRQSAGLITAAKIFAERWPKSLAVETFAAVAAASTNDPAWAGPLATPRPLAALITLAQAASVLDRAQLRRVPLNTAIAATATGAAYGWVGQGHVKKVSAMAFTGLRLDPLKTSGVVVVSDELLKLTDPATETFLRDTLVGGLAAWLDKQLLDPTVVAVAGVNPGSLTSTATSIPATSDPKADVLALVASFGAANPSNRITVISSPANDFAIASALSLRGDREGVTFLPSAAAGSNVIALDPDAIVWGEAPGGTTFDFSRQAVVQMNDTPSDPVTAADALTSLWQLNLVGLKVERIINWQPVRTSAVMYVAGAAYGTPTP